MKWNDDIQQREMTPIGRINWFPLKGQSEITDTSEFINWD